MIREAGIIIMLVLESFLAVKRVYDYDQVTRTTTSANAGDRNHVPHARIWAEHNPHLALVALEIDLRRT